MGSIFIKEEKVITDKEKSSKEELPIIDTLEDFELTPEMEEEFSNNKGDDEDE